MEEYEVNLADYLRVLWRGKWIVIIITVAAVTAGIIFSLNIPSLYQARTQLMITPIIAEGVANAEMRPLLLAPETYRSLATARDLLREVGDAVYGPGEITVEGLAGRMQVTIDGVEVFPLLTMTVIGSNPQVAADLANTWARLFMERNSAFLMSRIARSYDFIAATFAEVQTDLLAKEEERKVFERENPRDLLAAELGVLQSLHQRNMALLEEKRNSLAAEEARIAQIKEEWAETEPVIVLHQGFDLREIGVFLAGELTAEELAALPALVVKREEKNMLFFSLERQIREGRVTTAGLQAAINRLEDIDHRAKIAELSAQLIAADLTLAALDRDIATLQEAHYGLTQSLLNARIVRAEEPKLITVVEAAIVPQVPIGPRRMVNVAIAGILGLMIGVFAAFAAHYLKDNRKIEERPIGTEQRIENRE